MLKKLLLLGVSTGTLELVRYAKSQGIHVIITDNLPDAHVSIKSLADEVWNISTNDLDALEQACRIHGVHGVFAGVSEFNLDMVKELTSRLGLPCYFDYSAWGIARDKFKFKYYCKQVGVPVSEDYALHGYPTDKEINKIKFPVVVKPVDKSSNRGLSFCSTKEELLVAIDKVKTISDNENIIIERKLEGIELTAYYAIAEGKSSLVSLYSDLAEPDTPNYCYTLNSSVSNRLLSQYLETVNAKVMEFISTIGCRDGIVWFEIMYDKDNQFYFLEMGHRLPGDMMFMPLHGVTGFNSIAWLVDYSLGVVHRAQDLPQTQLKPYDKCACSYYLWSKKSATICHNEELKQLCDSPDFYVHIIRDINQSVEAFRPIVAITFSSNDYASMCATIKQLNKIQVLDENEDDILIHFTDFDELDKLYYTLVS